MSEEQLTFVFGFDALAAQDSFNRIVGTLVRHNVTLDLVQLDREPTHLSAVLPKLKSVKRNHYSLRIQDFEFDQSLVRNFSLERLSIKADIPPLISWQAWASEFIGTEGFVMAWLADVEYEFWQNAYDPFNT